LIFKVYCFMDSDQFLEVCFSQYGVIQTDVLVIWYVIENFKSYRPLLVSSLHLKYKNCVDSSIQNFSINIDNESVCRIHKTINFAYQMFSKMSLVPIAYDQFLSSVLDWILQACLFLICYARWKRIFPNLSSLHLKYKNCVDSSIQNFSINIDNESVCRIHKTINFAYQILRSTLGLALLAYSPPNKVFVIWETDRCFANCTSFFLSAISDWCICLTCQSCHPKYQQIFDCIYFCHKCKILVGVCIFFISCSEKSDVAMVRTDQFLEVCFSQYGVIQTDVIVIRYVIENFKSYRPLLVSSLHLKYKNCVDSSIQNFSINYDQFLSSVLDWILQACLFLICYARWKRIFPNLYQLCTPFFLCFYWGDCKREERDICLSLILQTLQYIFEIWKIWSCHG
jgi:large-conductance mechanosensitive channel